MTQPLDPVDTRASADDDFPTATPGLPGGLHVVEDTPIEKPRPRFTSNVLASVAILFDLLAVAATMPLAASIYGFFTSQHFDASAHMTGAVIVAVNFMLIRLSRDSYSAPIGRTGENEYSVAVDFLLALVLAVATVWLLGLLHFYSRGLILVYAVAGVGLLMAGRIALRLLIDRLIRHGYVGQRVVIYGADEQVSNRVIRLLEMQGLPHLRIAGVADERDSRVTQGREDGIPVIGGVGEIARLARRGEIDQVLIAVPGISQQRLEHLTEQLANVAVDLCVIPREALDLDTSFRVQYIGSAPMFYLWNRPLRDLNGVAKTIEDKLLAGVALLFLSPLLLLVAAIIKLTSAGPVFFVQKRFGFNNVEIDVIKFRSMYVDLQDRSGAQRTQRGDPRVTPIGRIIRKLSIDELPQLWNVLRGDMSLVGPRPHATQMMVGDRYYFDAVRGYAARHRVRPGITGLAQVRGLRGEIDSIERARQRVALDLTYIDNWSLALDARILLETVFKIIVDRHAY